jgi:midasin
LSEIVLCVQAILTSGINILRLSQACATSPEELSSVLFAVNVLLRCGCILESRSLLNVSLCSLLQAVDNVVRRQTSDLLCNLMGVTPSFRARCQFKFARTSSAFRLSLSSSTLLSSSLRRMQTRDNSSMDTSNFDSTSDLYRKANYSLIEASIERKYSVQICGMNVPIFKKLGPDAYRYNSANKSSQIRPVDCSTTRENLRKLVTAIMMDRPFILQGPAGSGKSYLLKQVAELVGQRDGVVELNLDEQVDSKTLLGNFVCTDVPGEFVWRPGILTSSVIEGNWLVLENFERISIDIIASIVYLLETKRLPGYAVGKDQDIIAHPAFRLIGTQTVIDSSHTELSSMRHLISFFHIVRFSPLAVDELEVVLEVLFPQIIAPARRVLLQVFYTFLNAKSGSRKISIRDLIKVGRRLCKRIDFNYESKHMPEIQRHMACLECVDIFCISTRDIKLYESEILAVGLAWGLAPEVIYSDVINRKTPLSVGSLSISIGRVDFPKTVKYDKKDTSRGDIDFSFTNYSMQLMEKVASAISQDEVVLLVGETG